MLLGAHVSTAGGVRNAPGRGEEIGATAIQIFTKMPSRWAEKPIDPDEALEYRTGCERVGIRFGCSHDSYLINLATADEVLRERSYASFRSELERSRDLGLDAVVTHPGNATDGDLDRGLAQNAALIQRALEETGVGPMVLLETTAGSGQVLGSRFEELARIREAVDPSLRDRVGICFDTCHVFSAGYDLRDAYDEVMAEFDRTIGLEHLRLFHLNDSQRPFGSRKDRHAEIGEGSLGDGPFRRIMTDPRFVDVPRVLETPKGDDPAVADRRNLGRLRSFLAEPAEGTGS
jgi:deoxyribonuclease IV